MTRKPQSHRLRPFRCRFDFEVGHLVQSPCRGCEKRPTRFPVCMKSCEILDGIQAVLTDTISSVRPQ
jgi:hypothetical protein